MFKTFDMTEVVTNVETAQKQCFDNVENIVNAFYGASTANIKMAREMADKANKQVQKSVKA